MNSFSMPVLYFALVLSFIRISNTQNLSFCEEFAKNGYKISYGFRRILKEDPLTNKDLSISYIFIGQNYWRLTYTDNRDDAFKRVDLLAEEGKQSNGFGNQYSMAFCVWNGTKCVIGLITSGNEFIEWHEFEDSVEELKVKSLLTKHSIDLNRLGNIRIVFVPIWGQFKHRFVIFFEQRPSMSYGHYFNINNKDELVWSSGSGWLGNDGEESTYPGALKDFITESDLQLISVLAKYSQDDNTQNGGSWGHGMIVLFQFNRSIKYCYTYTKTLSKTCKSPKTLIDCSQTVITTPTTTTTEKTTVSSTVMTSTNGSMVPTDDDKISYVLWILFGVSLLVCISLVVLLISVIGLVVYLRNKQKKRTQNS